MERTPFSTSYEVCRTSFRMAAALAGAEVTAHAIEARGPGGVELTVDVAQLGPAEPERVVLVMAGVHGVEGFATSPIMCDALDRWGRAQLADGVGVVLVHAVNPWGMAWWRRQNESNVDLNRNWARDDRHPDHNDGYAALHAALCPAGDEPPSDESLLEATGRLIHEHDYRWVVQAVSGGQYEYPDGLYFGGDRTEPSTAIMASIVSERMAQASEVLVVDLHTGFGDHGTLTLLAQPPEGSEDDAWIRGAFPDVAVHNATPVGADPTGGGQIAAGLAELVPGSTWRAVTMELGTIDETAMILVERAEHWVHRHGDPTDPAHAAIRRRHLEASTPTDPRWQAGALALGRRVLDHALTAVRGDAT